MKQDIQRIMLAAAKPLFLIFILYILKIMEVGMDWDFSRLGVYPMEKRGLVGILTHPLIHSGFSHLLANTIPLFFLSWCLFYFYRGIAGKIFILIWFGGGLLTFLIGKPGWHIGASGLIYGLAFFLFFSGILRKYVPLIAISLLVTFLYGGIIWHMFPYFSPTNMSWEPRDITPARAKKIVFFMFMSDCSFSKKVLKNRVNSRWIRAFLQWSGSQNPPDRSETDSLLSSPPPQCRIWRFFRP